MTIILTALRPAAQRSPLRRRVPAAVTVTALIAAGLVLTPLASASADSSITNAASLAAAVSAGGAVTLDSSITVTAADAPLVVLANKSVTLDLNGKALTVTGSTNNAGIGVSFNGALTIIDTSNGDGSVTAIGGMYGAGIGGSYASSGTVSIMGGTVTATGGAGGAGIGGGYGGFGGAISIMGGIVTATGGLNAAALGGGVIGGSRSVVIGADAVVTAIGATTWGAVGSGVGAPQDIKLSNAGTLTIPPGNRFTVDGGGAVQNSGTLNVNGMDLSSTLENSGTIVNTGIVSGGAGKLVNTGTIVNTGMIPSAATVTVNNFVVTFDESYPGAPAPAAAQRVYASTLSAAQIALPAPLRTGYAAPAWFSAATGGTAWGANTAITGDLTVYARWSLDTHTVAFDSDGGSAVVPVTTDYGTAITAPTPPTRDGHTFDGWFANGATTAFDFDTTITASITLTAHWSVAIPSVVPPANTTVAQSLAGGGTVAVSGSGFIPGQSVEVWLHSDPVRLGALTVGLDGTVAGRFTIPANTPAGAHHIVLVDEAGTEYTSATVTVTETRASTRPLASTGTPDQSGILLTALTVLLLGSGILALRRRRQPS